MQGKLVYFSATAINWFYNLVDEDNEVYRALFQNTDYQQLMRFLTKGRGEWKCHPSTSMVTIFQMKNLTPIAKVWYKLLCAKLKSSLHLITITKDKTILLYLITQGIKFDVEHVIERGIIESAHGRCTRALMPLSHLPALPKCGNTDAGI